MSEDKPANNDGHESGFSLNDFKQWMETQQGDFTLRTARTDEMLGKHVYPKLPNSKRLGKQMSIESGEVSEVIRDFKRGGGIVTRVDEHYLIVEVDSGSFAIPKYFVIS